ncbi:hypothetical protein Leryth_017055 [Lithospermum erythrorhizon]|nr:hypothetical protein Leryth_017055 [Lithospermum erythrorhizon]
MPFLYFVVGFIFFVRSKGIGFMETSKIGMYRIQAEQVLKEYLVADAIILYSSVIGGVCACKMIYDLSQAISAAHYKNYFSLSKPQQIEWNNRAISTLHALFITIMSLYLAFWSDLFSDDRLYGTIMLRRSSLSTFALGVSIGYFLSDLGMIIWFYPSLGGSEYVVHHLLSMVAIAYAMLAGEGQLYTYMVLISETTTPSVNLRWYLDTAGMKRSKTYLINGIVMTLGWMVARILLFVYIFCHVYLHYDQVIKMQTFGIILVHMVPSVLAIMNIMWFAKIMRGLKKMVAKRQ